MINNGQIGAHVYNQGTAESDVDKAFAYGASMFKSGMSMFAKAGSQMKKKAEETGLSEKVTTAAYAAKAKADETGVSNALHSAQQNFSKAAHSAMDYTAESGKSIYQSAQEGTLKDKTQQKATQAGAMMGQIGQSLFNSVQSFMGNQTAAQQPQPAEMQNVPQQQSSFDFMNDFDS